MKRALRTAVLVLLACAASRAALGGEPRREDHGALIVLHLYVTYEEMGRQHATLLGPLAPAIYRHQRAGLDRLTRDLGFSGLFVDLLAPMLATRIGDRFDRSSAGAELAGMADALDVSRENMYRAMLGVLAEGSTGFAATRTATTDGRALIGKNTDWSDARGLRRPVVIVQHPSNGDLASIAASWPLSVFPNGGVNEAGFALSWNFFSTDDLTGGFFSDVPQRRALQTARTVDDGIRMFVSAASRRYAAFILMADAGGDIALVECTASACGVLRPRETWLAHANHARTEPMIPHDHGRTRSSFARQTAMEQAVRGAGLLDPRVATHVLRGRPPGAALNGPGIVANPKVLNSYVIHPATRTLWHSTSQQPFAPFGEMIAITLDSEPSLAAPLPADPWPGPVLGPELIAQLAALRHSLDAFDAGRFVEAGAILAQLAARSDLALDRARLAWASARVHWRAGSLAAAASLLAPLESATAPLDLDLRTHATALHGWLLERPDGSRQTGAVDPARDLYRRAAEQLDAAPDLAAGSEHASLRDWLATRLRGGNREQPPPTPDLQFVPR